MPLDERLLYRLIYQEMERKIFQLQRAIAAYFDSETGHTHSGEPGDGGDLGDTISTAQDLVLGEDISADGVQTVFQTAYAYYSLAVYLDGLRLQRNEDYTEDGANGAFTMLWVPLAGAALQVDYIRLVRGGFGLGGFGSPGYGT